MAGVARLGRHRAVPPVGADDVGLRVVRRAQQRLDFGGRADRAHVRAVARGRGERPRVERAEHGDARRAHALGERERGVGVGDAVERERAARRERAREQEHSRHEKPAAFASAASYPAAFASAADATSPAFCAAPTPKPVPRHPRASVTTPHSTHSSAE